MAIDTDETLLACPTARILLCGPVPNRQGTSTYLGPRDWGSLTCVIYVYYENIYITIHPSVYLASRHFVLSITPWFVRYFVHGKGSLKFCLALNVQKTLDPQPKILEIWSYPEHP